MSGVNELVQRFEALELKKQSAQENLTAVRARKETLEERKKELEDSLRSKYKIDGLEALETAIAKLENELEQRVAAVESAVAAAEGGNG